VSRDVALYIHVPFCRRKCPYCSFVSYDYRGDDIPLYLNALKRELKQRAGGEHVPSVFFGGGTPSLLPAKDISDILSLINTLFNVDKAAEITLEANPGTVDEAYLTAVRKLGVNRLSLGVQSLNDRELVLLGRIHNAAQARDAVRFARSAGFDNLSLDLIYGLPGQTLDGWQHSLDEALALKTEHLSLYGLTLEEDTPMWTAISQGFLPALDPDLSADMYELAEDKLADSRYEHYEISNWARRGLECRHNLTYWCTLPYIGAGAAAHSCINGHRLANTKDLDKYMDYYSGKKPPLPELDEEISPELELAETIILGLRLVAGINSDEVNSRFGIDILAHYHRQIEEVTGAGLMEQIGRRLRLTRRGRLLSNEVFWRFLPD
jgi:oxygen-independent coproporphyrinogen III oxidase